MMHPGGSDNDSSYRVLIDKSEFHHGGGNRGQRVKSLLSGGFGKPQMQAPPPPPGQQVPHGLTQQNLWMHNNPGRAPSNLPTSTTMTPMAPSPGFAGSFLGGMNQPQRQGLPYQQQQHQPPFQSRYGGLGGAGAFGRSNPPSRYGSNTWGRTGSYGNNFGRYGSASQRYGQNGSGQYGSGYQRYGRHESSYDKRDRSSRRPYRSKYRSSKAWFDPDSSEADSRYEKSRKKYRHSRRHEDSSSDSGDSSDSSSHSASSKRRNRYGVSDTESNASYTEDSGSDSRHGHRRRKRHYKGLDALQKKMVLNTIQEYLPENYHHAAYEELMGKMEMMEKKGFKLPKGYDKRKHDMPDNEIRLYEQQLMRDKNRDQKKMSYMINFSALGLSWFCQCISVDWIRTKHLPEIIRTALEDGEFDDCLEGIGMYLRGTVFDNPVFSTILKFVEKIGEAHHMEMEEEQEKLEEEEDRKEVRHAAALSQMNMFRQPGGGAGAQNQRGSGMAFDLPPPKVAPRLRDRTKNYNNSADSDSVSSTSSQDQKKMM